MQKVSNNKKGIAALNLLISASSILLVAFIILIVGTQIMEQRVIDVNATAPASYAYNSTELGVVGLENMVSQSGLLGTVIVLTVIILIILGLLYKTTQNNI